ncbi:hypothetical protein SCUCBS95973_007208 [Sporothrix curviconia]|uniref:Beta-mannosidase Ig-fold domain-containing protein n=1 Tax=Sporothrix curviconia TaxID=1260050 RepID=A0ABP0CCL4_9PEZI
MLLPNKLTGTVTVIAERPVKGFVFTEKADGVTFSDNGFDIMPGEVQLVFLNKKTRESAWPKLEYNYVGKDIWKDTVVEQQESRQVSQKVGQRQGQKDKEQRSQQKAQQKVTLAVLVAGALVVLVEATVSAAALDVGNSSLGHGGKEEGGNEEFDEADERR